MTARPGENRPLFHRPPAFATMETTPTPTSTLERSRVRRGLECVGLPKRFRLNNMAALANDTLPAIWHAFDFLDDAKCGQVPKSKLKVLTANLGTVLNSPNVESGLQDYRSTPYLGFEDYMYYLRKELFAVNSTCVLEPRDHCRYLALIEEVCWLVCRSKYLKRDEPVLPDVCVFQLFRIFCMLAEAVPGGGQLGDVVTTAVLASDEVEYIVQNFVLALGKEWNLRDFQQIAEVVPTFKFAVFLALLEGSYSKSVEVPGLIEAMQEVYEIFIEDVMKKGILSKKGHFFSTWKACWFVLRPPSLTYYADRSERERRGEIPIHAKCTIESVAETPNSRGNKFSLNCGDKCFEFAASDHKTKLQWMTALKVAIEHNGQRETYQKRLASRRRAERESSRVAKKEEESSLVFQQTLLEKQRSELEAEKLARVAAEAEAQLQASLREQEAQRLKEVETAKMELEQLLAEERQAKRDEEIVRNLQARLLREEWDKREELERLQAEQVGLLVEERNKREGLEQDQQQKESQLEEARKKLAELEAEKGRLDRQLKDVTWKCADAENAKRELERRLKEAQDKMVVAERAKEVLESKLRVREKSFIPIPVGKSGWNRSSQITYEHNNGSKMTDQNRIKRGNSRKSFPSDEDEN